MALLSTRHSWRIFSRLREPISVSGVLTPVREDRGASSLRAAAYICIQNVSTAMECEQGTVSGRRRKPAYKKLNPIWCFGNEDEEQLPDWYQPIWPFWRRRLYWYYFRNPLQNFRAYVLGVNDRNYEVIGRPPVMGFRDTISDQTRGGGSGR